MTDIDVRTGSGAVDLSDGRTLSLNWAAVTDTGRKRQVNQDALIVELPVFAVADGMGGHDAGEVASAAVVERFRGLVAEGKNVDRGTIEGALRDAVEDMFNEVGHSDLGTGTTVTGLMLASTPSPGWTVFNIGDSRVYRLLGDELIQVTLDHSVVQELIAIGAITPDEAETHPHGNVITRAVGFTEDPVPDYTDVPATSGARWLVCSDGLTKELTDYGLQHFLMRAESPKEAVELMVTAALDNGGRDNVSAIVLDELITP